MSFCLQVKFCIVSKCFGVYKILIRNQTLLKIAAAQVNSLAMSLYPYKTYVVPVSAIIIILHALCLVTLVKTYRGRSRAPQHLLLINLSASIVTRNAWYIIANVIDETYDIVDDDHFHLIVFLPINNACVFTVYVFAIALINCDRLLSTILPLRYRLTYYTVGKAKVSIFVVWCTIWIIFTCLLIIFLSMPGDILYLIISLFGFYVPKFELVLSGVYFIFAISTYVLIFSKYSRSRHLVTSHNNRSFIRNFKNFKFSVPIILVGSFFLFRTLPHLIYYLLTQGIIKISTNSYRDSIFLENALYATRFVPDIIDALVYVLLYSILLSGDSFERRCKNLESREEEIECRRWAA